MDLFSISQLSRFSGIKPHTIRIWEQRYDALKPFRSEGNTRYYDNTQLRRLLNIVSLQDMGYKVSELAKMGDKAMFRLIEEQEHEQPGKNEFFISQIIAAGMAYDEITFNKYYAASLKTYGDKDLYIHIIYPVLKRIGVMWASDRIALSYEHFITHLIRKKIIAATEELDLPKKDAETWMLFLPEDEYHEMGLLFSAYLLQLAGKKVIYIGASVPFDSLKPISRQSGATKLLSFFVVRQTDEAYEKYTHGLHEIFPGKKIYIASDPELIQPGTQIKNLKWLHTVEALCEEIGLTGRSNRKK